MSANDDFPGGSYAQNVRDETNRILLDLKGQNERLRSSVAALESDRSHLQLEKIRLQEQLMNDREDLARRIARAAPANGATMQLLQIVAAVYGVPFAVLRIEGCEPIVNRPDAPLQMEEELFLAAARRHGNVVVADAAALKHTTLQCYAAAPLADDAAGVQGRLAVMSTENRQFTEHDQELLVALGMQLLRAIETEAMFRLSAERQRQLQVLLDETTVGLYMIENGRFSYVNRTFAQTLGYTKEEILALQSITDLIVEQQHAVIRQMIERRTAGDKAPARYPVQVRCRDGSVVETEIHSTAIDVDERRVIIGAAVDVTARSNSTRRIKEREEYFRALTENVSDVIAILDPTSRISYVSPSVERILGYRPEELIGKTQFSFIHPDDRDRVVEAFRRLASRSGPVISETYRFQRKEGGWRVLESVGTNLLDHPQIRGLVVNTRDATDRKLLEQELEQMNRLTSIGRLAAQVAHEFNNVLMGIQPVVDIMRRQGVTDPQLARLGELVAASISRGKRITTDILRFGRPAQPMLRTVAAEELLEQVAEELRPLLPSNTELDVDAADAPMFVVADRAQLSQVLVNLVLNARDAMPANGGTITLRVSPGQFAERRHRFVQFTVSDTGEGIAREDLPHIFEPLFTTKRNGTGLGLSVVFQVVTAHRGHIAVESEPGKGSTFDVFIPAAVGEIEDPQYAADHHAVEQPVKTRVLLVEDDEAVAAGLQWSLEMEGIDVRVVTTGRDVLPAVESWAPDVIVLDLNLPDADGRSVYQRLSSQHTIPVIFSTGHALEHEIDALLDGPNALFLMKPYSTEELMQAIRELLEGKEPA